MLEGVNLEVIKKYNSDLKQYKDRAAALNAEIEYTNKELDTLCVELTQELGISVTRDNIEQIYNDQVNKINSILQSGNAVLAKIASEEQAMNAATMPQVQTVQSSQPQIQTAQPIQTQVQTQQTIGQTQQPVAGSIFNNSSQSVAQPISELPTMFKI